MSRPGAVHANGSPRGILSLGGTDLLVARPGGLWDQGRCCSCGDALEADERYRCGPCVAATVAVLETVA